MKRKLLFLIATLMKCCGVNAMLRPVYGGPGVILMMHRFADHSDDIVYRGGTITTAFFETLLVKLSRMNVDVIALKDVPERLKSDNKRRFVCLTFDDGYRDNLTCAVPLLEQYQMPATIFVSSNAMSGRIGYVWDGLEDLIARHDSLDINGVSCNARTPAEKQAAFHVFGHLILHHYDEWTPLIQKRCADDGVNFDDLTAALYMNKDEIKALDHSAYVDIGGHTLSHPMLAQCSPDDAVKEITQNRMELSNLLGRDIECFAYPFGGAQACGVREYEMVKQAGYKLAVTTRAGAVFEEHGAQCHTIPRFAVSGLYEHNAVLDLYLSGAWRALRTRFGRPFVTD
jgi:peptidoglycan/xylan/chitin deacetylase (PgdA/CDA1 family)